MSMFCSVVIESTLHAMAPPRYKSLLDLAIRRGSWLCSGCAKAGPMPSVSARTTRGLRTASQNTRPSMEQMRKPFAQKNANTAYYTLSIIIATVALSYGSVPLYKTICQQTGWGGTPIKSAAHAGPLTDDDDVAARLTPVTSSRRLRITFAGSTSDILPWKFTPQQREVRVLPGETALAFYTATNNSKDEDIIGVATYSVTPAQVAPYFSKIQCFCFEEQRLNKGETVDMPVFFYIDPDFLKDPTMRNIDTITLNYTFFSRLPFVGVH